MINIILVSLFFIFLVIYILYECFIRENRVLNIFGRMRVYSNIINNSNKSTNNSESFNYDEV